MKRRDVLWLTLVTVLLATVIVANDDSADAGTGPPGAGIDLVYVAVGTNFPDSLGGGPPGGVGSAPIIILPTDPPIPSPSKDELVRLDPKRVTILGGTAVISASMETAIQAVLPNATIDRIAGANRYQTNAMLSESIFPIERWVSVPAAAFNGSTPAVQDVMLNNNEAWNDTTGYLIAPVHLPDGAEILELKAAGNDTHVSLNAQVYLYRSNLAGSVNTVNMTASSGSGGAFVASEPQTNASFARVDNSTYAYTVVVFNADDDTNGISIFSVLIKYRLGMP